MISCDVDIKYITEAFQAEQIDRNISSLEIEYCPIIWKFIFKNLP
jgi:hypothetical protein